LRFGGIILSQRIDNKLPIDYPTLSELNRYRPYTLKYFPVIQFEDLCDTACFHTPYLRLIKGVTSYYLNDKIGIPNTSISTADTLYRYHVELYHNSILELLKMLKTQINPNEPTLDLNLWNQRLMGIVPQTHHNLIPMILNGFVQLLTIYQNNVHTFKNNTQMFDAFVFNPEIPIPLDQNNQPFMKIRPPQTRLIELNIGNSTSPNSIAYFFDPTTIFPGCGKVPLIDFTTKTIFDFLYFDPAWIMNYNPVNHNLYTQAYLFDVLFNLWIWRYAIKTLADVKGNGFHLEYFVSKVFPTSLVSRNQIPNISMMDDFDNFQIKVVTPNQIYDETEFDTWGLDPNQILAEKMIATTISLSNQPYKVLSLPINCPFSGLPFHEKHCSFNNGGTCFVRDVAFTTPLLHELNVEKFQKLLRNEYFRYSKFFYLLDFSLGRNNIDEYQHHYKFHIGKITQSGGQFSYIDQSPSFGGTPPINPEKALLIPITPYFYSTEWIFEYLFLYFRRGPASNPEIHIKLKELFTLFNNPPEIDVILTDPQDFKLLFLIQKQQAAIWNITKHKMTDNQGNFLLPEEILEKQLKNKAKRAGAAFFGNRIYYNE
jgi:hypothetical protein